MKAVIQRVKKASVTVEGNVIGAIQEGLLVLLGISKEDTKEEVKKFVNKIIGLRIFADENGKTNLSLQEINGELLVVSQFTLYADCKKGEGLVLSMQVIQKLQMNFMNFLLHLQKKK